MFENNQTNSKRGGARKNAGRKAGAATKKTREIADKAAAEGVTPLEYLLKVMNTSSDPRACLTAAIAAAPYVHARLASVEVTGEGGGAIDHSLTVRFVSK